MHPPPASHPHRRPAPPRWAPLLAVGALALFPAGGVAKDPVLAPAAGGTGPVSGESESDDVGSIIDQQESAYRRGERSIIPGWWRPWGEQRIAWQESHGLQISSWYDALAQGSIGGGGSASASGEFGIGGQWAPFHDFDRIREGAARLSEKPLTLNFRVRHRHAYGSRAPGGLAEEIGAKWGTTDAFNDRGAEIPDFHIRQPLPRWNLELRYGQLSVEDQLDEHALRGVKRSFLNRAFSTNPAVAFPRFGAGGTVRWTPWENWDFTVAMTQVQASKAGDQIDFQLDSSSLFYGVQVGYRFEGWRDDPARVQALLWHSDEVEETGSPSGKGLSVTLEQALEHEGIRAFARFATSSSEATDVSTLFAAGLGLDRGNADLLGFAIGMGQSSIDSDWQVVVECFYRWQAAAEFHITPEVQILFGEGLEGSGSVRLLPGIRGRMAF